MLKFWLEIINTIAYVVLTNNMIFVIFSDLADDVFQYKLENLSSNCLY